MMPGRKYSARSTYRYGFNGKENDNEVKGEGNQQDYGMRIYDPRLGKFFSVDPLRKDYPGLTPYQFASNTPIQAVDLDGKEAKVSFETAVVSKDRSWIEVKSAVSIKVQIINLSGVANSDLDLQNLALNLGTDLQDKLGGKQTTIWSFPFYFQK